MSPHFNPFVSLDKIEERKVLYPGKAPVQRQPHLLTLEDLGEGDWDIDVEHTDDCLDPYGDLGCDVAYHEDWLGLPEFFIPRAYAKGEDWSLLEVLIPGQYWIEAWSECYQGFDYEEWDSWLRLVYDEGQRQ